MEIIAESKYNIGDAIEIQFGTDTGLETRTVEIHNILLEVEADSALVIYGVNDPEVQTVLERDVIGLGTPFVYADPDNSDNPPF